MSTLYCYRDGDQATKIGKYFSAGEFMCAGAPQAWFVDSRIVVLLDAIRDRIGKPVGVNSGFRTPEHNRKVGGAAGSRHLYGLAADIRSASVKPLELAAHAYILGCRRIGLATNYVHVDVDGDGEQLVYWNYPGCKVPVTELLEMAKGLRRATD